MMRFFPERTLELTFGLIKPHAAVIPPIIEQIKKLIIKNNYYVIKWKRGALDHEMAKKMYEEHEGKPFHKRLNTMMTSGPVECFVIARENAIQHWRLLMGPTKALESQYTHPDTLRGLYGLSNTRNAAHGSDSPESVKNEASIFFPDFSIDKWYGAEEVFFRNGYVKFDEKTFTHFREKEDFPKNMS